MNHTGSALISPQDLHDLLCPPPDASPSGTPAATPVIVFDASVDAGPTDPHIPGAFCADIDSDWSNPLSAFPHTYPQPEQFQTLLRGYGVNQDSVIVVYERSGLFSVARIWWLLRWAGLDRVFVLDGGLDAWQAAGLPTTTAPTSARDTGDVTVHLRPQMLLDEDAVLAHLESGDRTIIDARSRERFIGVAPEPRPGLRAGHIPSAVNLPFTDVQADGKLLPADALRTLFEPLIDARPIITSCGSGVTACVLALALHQIGRTDVSVYDGSWSQWGRLDGPPCEC